MITKQKGPAPDFQEPAPIALPDTDLSGAIFNFFNYLKDDVSIPFFPYFSVIPALYNFGYGNCSIII